MPHLVSGMNFLKIFANLLMMSPCHCHLIFLSPDVSGIDKVFIDAPSCISVFPQLTLCPS